MAAINWQRQSSTQPLFPDVIWSRPQNRLAAGKLLIIGGYAYDFKAVAEAYESADRAGAGSIRLLLPHSLKKVAAPLADAGLADKLFWGGSSAGASGGFDLSALADWLEHSQWADAVLLPGNLGRDSKTAVTLEHFLKDCQRPMALSGDAVDAALNGSHLPQENSQRLLVLNMAQLQRLSLVMKTGLTFTYSMDILRLGDNLACLTSNHPLLLILRYHDQLAVAAGGRLSISPAPPGAEKWLVITAAQAVVWWLQQPDRPFEALTSAVYSGTTADI